MASFCILLVDDHALFRCGMRLVLQSSIPHVEVSEAASMEQAVSGHGHPPKKLVLLGIQLQGVNGLEGWGLLKQRWPQVPVVMRFSDLDPVTARLALLRGAAAFMSKSDMADKIIQMIHQTLADGLPGTASTASRNGSCDKDSKPYLTPRQCEVLDLLCEELSNKLIARRLELSKFTVCGHVQAVFAMLQVRSRAQATCAARRIRLIG